MILLQRTANTFGSIDGSPIFPDALALLSIEQIRDIPIESERGTIALSEVFHVSMDRTHNEPFVVIEGDCSAVDRLGWKLQSGILCILGNAGDKAGGSMSGGTLVISGDARDQLGTGMSDGLIYVAGNCRHALAAPLPGKKSGMRGGDIVIAGSVGDRACERMRRGTVFIAGDTGDYCVPQMIAGSVIVMGRLGGEWGGGMRRGSLILGLELGSDSSASLSAPRDFELSFLPLIWKHVERLQVDGCAILNLAISFADTAMTRTPRHAPGPIRIPSTRWVQRRIADLNCNGRGEVLVLKRVSSSPFAPRK